MEPDFDPCTPEDLSATIFYGLGVGPDKKLPMPSGREVALFPSATVLSALCAG